MRIALSGYGKMGRAVERIASGRGHETVVLDTRHSDAFGALETDCVIDFTHAAVAPGMIRRCLEAGFPVVSGTTGWQSEMDAIRQTCLHLNGALLWAPNFSVGMHLTFAVNRALAALMELRPEYDVAIHETHHLQKKDAPSGTAIALAEQVLSILSRKSSWALENVQNEKSVLGITADRREEVKGIHHVLYKGPHDVISLSHEALSRDGFAFGAVLAAEWLPGRQGVFSFDDVLTTPVGPK